MGGRWCIAGGMFAALACSGPEIELGGGRVDGLDTLDASMRDGDSDWRSDEDRDFWRDGRDGERSSSDSDRDHDGQRDGQRDADNDDAGADACDDESHCDGDDS